MKDKIVQFISHPFIISLILTLVIINFLPDYFTKYKVELIESKYNNRKSITYFEDLNNDKKAEKIMSYANNVGMAGFEIHQSNGSFIDQWNFSGKYANDQDHLWFFDADGNHFKEIYLVSQKNDSVFLNVVEVFDEDGLHRKNIFIDTIPDPGNESYMGVFLFSGCDLNSNGSNEIIITLNKGFSGAPRNAYSYDPLSHEVQKSPHLTNQSKICACSDLDNDGKNELLIRNYSAGNEIDPAYTHRSDRSSWIMVLDEFLQFKFKPIEVKNEFSTIASFPIRNQKGEINDLCVINSKKSNESHDKLLLINAQGKVLKEKNLPSGDYKAFPGNKDFEFYLLNKQTGKLSIYDNTLNGYELIRLKPNSFLMPLNLDKSGQNFWVALGSDRQSVKIFDANFEYPVDFYIGPKGLRKNEVKLMVADKEMNDLYIQSKNGYYLYSYNQNPLYVLRYLIFATLFLMIFGVVWLIRKGQQLKTQKQRSIENEIAGLQIKTINNQLDPHFVFNAINTISEMTLLENKFDTDNFICKFSDFMRGSLNNSDKISTSLQEELEFVENFIQLQKIRYQNQFDHSIHIDQDVNLNTKVPKHIIFSYVENAIKHGLSQCKEKGLLQIKVSVENFKLLLVIEDNGPGISTDKKLKITSSGNGLRIMEEMFELYYKLYKKRIQNQVIELFDQDKNKIGFKVELRIST